VAGHEALAVEVLAQLASIAAAEAAARTIRAADAGAGLALDVSLRLGDAPLAVSRQALDRVLPEGTGVVTEQCAPAGAVTPSIPGLYGRLATLATGELEIVPITGPDGVVRYAVLLRGIDPLPNPTVNTAAQAVKTSEREADTYARAVAQALRLAGVPAGAELLVAGHSQGGIAAMNVAANGRWRVTHVLTAGSPIGNKPGMLRTQVLRIENRGDPVPQLDGDREPASPGRSVYAFGSDVRLSRVVHAHVLTSGYLPELASVRFAADPAVRAFTASAAPILHGAAGQPRRFRLEAGAYQLPSVLGG
jgi:hypothetical protein